MRNSIPFPSRPDGRPLCIAHRGASEHAVENTLEAFRIAAELGAEMWEIDVWLTADGHPVVAHDADLGRIHGVDGNIADYSLMKLRDAAPTVPSLDEVISLARDVNCALYVEIKGLGAGRPSIERLKAHDFTAAGLGSFNPAEVRDLVNANCPYPVSVLVPVGRDPFAMAELGGADIVHLCWERGGERPQDLVTPELIARAESLGLGVVLWHEERRPILDDLLKLPVLGICTNKPELMHGADSVDLRGIEIVSHRGAQDFAPENTMASARLGLDQGCQWIGVDVRETADGELVVIHDASLERTTNGRGLVADHSLAQLLELDAGSYFSAHYTGQKVPALAGMIRLCQSYGRQMHIENKDADPAKILAVVNAMGFADRCVHSSPDAGLAARLRSLSPDARIMSRRIDYAGMAALKADLEPEIVEIELDVYAARHREALALGLTPMLKYFGSDPAAFDQIVDWTPAMVNLDHASLLLDALRRKAKDTSIDE